MTVSVAGGAQEFATAAMYGAALIVIVVNNGMFGTIRMHQVTYRYSPPSLRAWLATCRLR